MYVVSLILLIVYYHHKRLGLMLIGLLIIGSTYIYSLYIYENNTDILYLRASKEFMLVIYFISWYKIGPYLIGTLFGIFYSESLTNENGFAYKFK